MQGETTAVTEGVQHALARRPTRHGLAIVPLISIIAGFLPFAQIDEKLQTVFSDCWTTRARRKRQHWRAVRVRRHRRVLRSRPQSLRQTPTGGARKTAGRAWASKRCEEST